MVYTSKIQIIITNFPRLKSNNGQCISIFFIYLKKGTGYPWAWQNKGTASLMCLSTDFSLESAKSLGARLPRGSRK